MLIFRAEIIKIINSLTPSSSIYGKRKQRTAFDTSVKYGGVIDGLRFGEKLGPMPFTTVVNTLKTGVKKENYQII